MSALSHASAAPADDPVLDHAERLLLARGAQRLGLAEVARAAGVEPAALRDRYPSREDLLSALRQRFVAEFLGELARAMDRCRPGDWAARLRAWVQGAVDGYLDRLALHDALFHGPGHHHRHAMQDNPAIDQLVELLEGGIAARVWAAPDPRLTAVIFFNAMHSAVDRAIVCGEPPDRRRLAQILCGYFERSVQWWARF
ncbi:TetR/AcrR family transcriptional regulator [Lysobacter firmicutimachus]|uniref:TetR/AcrR family transcriptional regulator n=1 Tax=Lysobacter firmicutimachus TaxID=1792846 RepID=A0AAU8MZR9_9GAMM